MRHSYNGLVYQPSKLGVRVRFPYAAQATLARFKYFGVKEYSIGSSLVATALLPTMQGDVGGLGVAGIR